MGLRFVARGQGSGQGVGADAFGVRVTPADSEVDSHSHACARRRTVVAARGYRNGQRATIEACHSGGQ